MGGSSSSVEETYPSVYDVMQSTRTSVDQQIQIFKNKFDNILVNPDAYMHYTPLQNTIAHISRTSGTIKLLEPAASVANLAKGIQLHNQQLVMLDDNRVIVGNNDFSQFARDVEVVKNNLVLQLKSDTNLAESFGRLVASADQLAEDIKNFIIDFCKNNLFQPGFDTRTSETIIMQQNIAFVGAFTTCYNITTRTNEGTSVLSALGVEIKVATTEYIVNQYYWNLTKERQFLIDLKTMETLLEIVGSIYTIGIAKRTPGQGADRLSHVIHNVEESIITQQQKINSTQQRIEKLIKSPEITAIFAAYEKLIDGEKKALADLVFFCQTAMEEKLTASEFTGMVTEYRDDVITSFKIFFLEVRDVVLAHYIPPDKLPTCKAKCDKLEANLLESL